MDSCFCSAVRGVFFVAAYTNKITRGSVHDLFLIQLVSHDNSLPINLA